MCILSFVGMKDLLFVKISFGSMDPDFNLVTLNTFKTLHKHDTKTAKNASQRLQIQFFLNLITFLDIQRNYSRFGDL